MGSLLEVGAGFHSELTGRENIYLNGAILGMKKAEIDKKFDNIVAFAEIKRFIDTPVKKYSSGMYMRLAFAVAAQLEPEILIVDEVLAVGDALFQTKCLAKMSSITQQGRTVLFVSHNMSAISSICKTGILLEAGKISFAGPVREAVSIYLDQFSETSQRGIQLSLRKDRTGTGEARLVNFCLEDEDGKKIENSNGKINIHDEGYKKTTTTSPIEIFVLGDDNILGERNTIIVDNFNRIAIGQRDDDEISINEGNINIKISKRVKYNYPTKENIEVLTGKEIVFEDVSEGSEYLALGRLRDYLDNTPNEIKNDLNAKDFEEVIKEVEDYGPALVGMSVFTGYHNKKYVELSRYFKSRGYKIVWGNAHPSLLPRQVLSESCVDFVVFGEGDFSAFDPLPYLLAVHSADANFGLDASPKRQNRHGRIFFKIIEGAKFKDGF